jgi:hypothetical protein
MVSMSCSSIAEIVRSRRMSACAVVFEIKLRSKTCVVALRFPREQVVVNRSSSNKS